MELKRNVDVEYLCEIVVHCEWPLNYLCQLGIVFTNFVLAACMVTSVANAKSLERSYGHCPNYSVSMATEGWVVIVKLCYFLCMVLTPVDKLLGTTKTKLGCTPLDLTGLSMLE